MKIALEGVYNDLLFPVLKDRIVNYCSHLFIPFRECVMGEDEIKCLDKPVQEAVLELLQRHIVTNSSEGGGDYSHGAPDFSYVEVKLSPKNLNICQKHHFLLDKVYSRYGQDDFLFNGSALEYGQKTGYYIIGFKRIDLSDNQVILKFKYIINQLKEQ